MKKGLTLLEVLLVLIVLVVIAALLIPSIGGGRCKLSVACANNLAQLWKMQNVYTSQYGSRPKLMPPETGVSFWKALTKTQPPLIDPTMSDIFLCPAKGDSDSNAIDYGGPAKRMTELGDGDPVGADFPDNHKMYSQGIGSGNVLRKSGDVILLDGPDWTKLTADPLFPKR